MLSTELEGWVGAGGELSPDEVIDALERSEVRLARAGERGRVAVLDLARVRTRRFDAVFVLGLEQGSLPRRGAASPFLDDDARSELDGRAGARLTRPDPVARDRYLFYTACTRPTRRLYLVREAATDEGSPREASPFWHEVQALFEPDDVRRWTRRRPLSQLTWELEQAPTERERLRALARLAATRAGRRSGAGGRERLGAPARARAAGVRPPHRSSRIRACSAELAARGTFNVTELERFADCSSAWFFERLIDPKQIDRQVDAMLRGSVAHTTLNRFFGGLPKAVGTDRVEESRLDDALAFLNECLEGALAGVRMEMTELERRELEESLRRDLEQFVRDEAVSELPLVPRRFEVSFGSERSAPELQRGLDLGDGITLSGQDRPHRRRPGERPRDRAGLQVGAHRALGRRDREGAEAPDPALHARPARPRRDRAARRPVPAPGGRAARRAACSASRRRTTGSPASRRTTISTRRRSGHGSTAPRSSRRGSRSASARATCGTTPRAATVPPGATSGGCAA